MKVQLLIATMNQIDDSILQKMNIQSDAIVGNQCNENSIRTLDYHGSRVTFLNFDERGVGLNRNNALMRATADYCVFTDDDVVFYDNYVELILNAFKAVPRADVIVFNVDNEEDTEKRRIKKVSRVHNYNYMRYGAVRIAIKTESIRKNGIFFNLCFGGGTNHSSGEDTLFLHDCLTKKLHIYTFPITPARLENDRPSTWFSGYNDKYFRDKGDLFRLLYRRKWKIYCFVDAFRHRKLYGTKTIDAYRKMVKRNG